MPILASVDRDPGSEAVVETAHELATGLGQELILLHVIPESQDRERARREVEEIIENALGEGAIDSVELRLTDEPGGTHEVPSGRLADGVLNVADEVEATYIVVGSRKSTPIGKVMLGSVAQLVLINAEVPVVTVEQTRD